MSNPRQLKPGQLLRLLNSTGLGAVLDDRRLREQRARAGLRIGAGPTIDLFRYAAWLFDQPRDRPSPAAAVEASDPATLYAEKKERERQRNAAASRAGREIGELPPVADPQRRREAKASFRVFCETYLRQTFVHPWSRHQLRFIARVEDAALRGGLFVVAMPRGRGKTSLCEAAVLWCALNGVRVFIVLIGSDKDAACERLESIKTELQCNELLLLDYPEVCIPIRHLEGIANRARGQTHAGSSTHIRWGSKKVVLPTIPGSEAAGVVIQAAGLLGRIRGLKHKRADGTTIRPDLVIPDDPQTDASARSLQQCDARERTLKGAVLGLAGPDRKIAGVMPITVIVEGDLADRLLDRRRNPVWQGERFKMIEAWPADMKLWEEYQQLRAASLAEDGHGEEARAFYLKHRAAMDAGAVVDWEFGFDPAEEISSLQHAMNRRFDDETAFFAECQNEPMKEVPEDDELLGPAAIAAKINGLARGVLPLSATHLTAFVDVQHKVLYWLAVAWGNDFGGAVVDYGTFPDQGRGYFQLRSVRKTLKQNTPGGSLQAAVLAGVDQLSEALLSRSWSREDGSQARLNLVLVDSKDGQLTDTVMTCCRRSRHAAILLASQGKGIGPADTPMAMYKLKPGERAGNHWLLTRSTKHGVRVATIDTNFWKTFVHQRLATPAGDRGALTLFGEKRVDRKPDHRMLAEQLGAEYRERLRHEKTGRVVDVWRLKPAKPDNHFFDCLVGSAAGASMLGCSLLPVIAPRKAKPAKKNVSYL